MRQHWRPYIEGKLENLTHLDPPAVYLVENLHPDEGVEQEGEGVVAVELLALRVLSRHIFLGITELIAPWARGAQSGGQIVVVEAEGVNLGARNVDVGCGPSRVYKALNNGVIQGAGGSASEFSVHGEAAGHHDTTVP